MNDPQTCTVTSLGRISYQYDAHVFHISFPNFGSLPASEGGSIESPEFTCFGQQWKLRLYPGGQTSSKEGMVALYLERCSEGDTFKLHFELGVKGDNEMRGTTDAEFDYVCDSMGLKNFQLLSEVMDLLDDDGALTLRVHMREAEPADSKTGRHFTPSNPIPGAIRNIFNDKASSDMLFEVGGQEMKEGSAKRAKTTPTKFHAHRRILRECAPVLANICEQCDGEHPIEINDINPKIFQFVLEYLYGIEISEDDLKSHAKDIIGAADKYGVIGLKLQAEACYVESATINMDNVIENLLYAHSKNCALLNEAVVDFIIENGDDDLDRFSFSDVPGDVVLDLLAHIWREKKKRSGGDVGSDALDFNAMRVDDLRKMCQEKGLDVDKSRKTMISMLKKEQEGSD